MMRPLSMLGMCVLCVWVAGSVAQENQKLQLLKEVLQELSNDASGMSYEPSVDEYDWEDPAWEGEIYKRTPPSGFSAVRGKRQSEGKRVPSNKEFFGARGKKDELPNKRLPSNNEFFGMRGKKSANEKRIFWARWRGSQPWIKESIKRVPHSGVFYGARGKKNAAKDLDPNKRVLANHFFGARGKKSEEYSAESLDNAAEKRLNSGQFFGARGKKSDEFDKRFSNGDFFGARGKKSDVYFDEADKRLSKNQFFGARGKKSDVYFDEADKRLSKNQFFGARGRRSSSYELDNSPNDLSNFSDEDMDSSVIQ